MMTPHLARIARQPTAQAAVDAASHPWGTPDTPVTMPMTLVQIGSDGIAYQDMTPLYMPDGRAIPATAPHTWFQLRAAGRP
jgi:hypothetical protein